jgi:DNA-binding protein H-NS
MQMMNLKELMAQRTALDEQINALQKEAKAQAVTNVKNLVAEFGLTSAEIFETSRKASVGSGLKVAAKYRNPETGEVWTGRGRAPKWIDGKERDQFLIEKAAAAA